MTILLKLYKHELIFLINQCIQIYSQQMQMNIAEVITMATYTVIPGSLVLLFTIKLQTKELGKTASISKLCWVTNMNTAITLKQTQTPLSSPKS